MDPLSIAAAAVGLSKTAAKLGTTLYTFIDETKHVDDTLKGFASELTSLTKSLDAVGSALKTPQLSAAFISAAGVEEPRKHLKDVNAILDDCGLALEDLESTLNQAGPSGRFTGGFLRRPVTTIKLNLSSQTLMRIQQRIRTHNNAMQLCLQTIHLVVSVNDAAKLATAIEGVKVELLKMHKHAETIKNNPEGLSGSKDTKKSLVQSFQGVVSSAETILSTSSEYGSNTGATVRSASPVYFSADLELRTRTWIVDEQRTSESEDENFERDYLARFAIVAGEQYNLKNYEKAKAFLSKFIEGAEKYDAWDTSELFESRVKLAACQSAMSQYSDAAKTLAEISSENLSVQQSLSRIHYLAEVSYLSSTFDFAQRYAKEAVSGRRRACGRNSPEYFASIGVLVLILKATGKMEEAEIYSTYLPNGHSSSSLFLAQGPGDRDLDESKPENQETQASALSIGATGDYTTSQLKPPSPPMSLKDKLPTSPGSRKGTDIDNANTAALISAIRNRDESKVEALLKCGVDVEARADEEDQPTALIIAAGSGYTLSVKMLLLYGAKVDSTSLTGETALCYALKHTPWAGAARLLIRSGADVNHKSKAGKAPLHYAVEKTDPSLAEELLSHGANVEILERDTMSTPLMCAAKSRSPNLNVLKLLIRAYEANIRARDNLGRTPLHLAASSGRADTTRFLLHSGAEVNARTDENLTPLIYAIRGRNQAIVELLIRSKADVQAESVDGRTSLHEAARIGDSIIASQLLKAGARVYRRDLRGKSSEDLAITGQHHELAQLLRRHQERMQLTH